MSRRELANRTGSSSRTIEGWELGRHRPDRRARRVLRELWEEGEKDGGREEDGSGDKRAVSTDMS